MGFTDWAHVSSDSENIQIKHLDFCAVNDYSLEAYRAGRAA